MEHKRDKDFSDCENVEVKELVDEKLSFDFTWNYEQTCENADKVSKREADLVRKFNTQDSVFQRADGGGQTWATEKGFVKSNKDNPRFYRMSGAEIKACLKEEKTVTTWLGNFVSTMRPAEEVWLHSFVSTMRPAEEVWLSSFVSTMRPAEEVWLGSFVNHMLPAEEVWINNFVNNMRLAEEVWLSNFVNNMRPAEEVWLNNFVSTMRPAEDVWLHNFVGNMKNKRR